MGLKIDTFCVKIVLLYYWYSQRILEKYLGVVQACFFLIFILVTM